MRAERAERGPPAPRSWVDALDAEFFAEYFERRPFVARGADPDPERVISVAELEYLLISPPGARFSYVRLAKVGADDAWDRTKLDPDFKLGKLVGGYRAGYSIVVDEVNYRWPRIYAECVALQAAVAKHASVVARSGATCGLFLTPPHARGTELHYDCKDVFVVQVAGSKAWRLHAPPVEAPLRNSDTGEVDPARAGPPVLEATLFPGDVLYMPRGFLHAPLTEAAFSLHLSYGISTVTWSDVLTALMAQRAPVRRSIPKRVLDGGSPDAPVRQLVSELAASLDDPDDASRTFARLAAGEMSAERQIAGGVLSDAVSNAAVRIAKDDALEKRYGARCSVELTEREIVVTFPGGTVAVPSVCASAVERIVARDRITLAELRRLVALDDARLLAAKLVEAGFLRVVGRAPA